MKTQTPVPHPDPGPVPAPGAGSSCDPTVSPEGQTGSDCELPTENQLKSSSSCYVYLERHRRKRITESCVTLRRLLPISPGGRVDMVTVLKRSITFLQSVQDLGHAHKGRIQVCPPAELHSDWLLQSQQNKEVGHKMTAKLREVKGPPTTRPANQRASIDSMETPEAVGDSCCHDDTRPILKE